MKRTLIIISVIIILTLLLLEFAIRTLFKINSRNETNEKLDSTIFSQSAPKEYLELFPNLTKGLKIDRTDKSKRRNPISEFIYNNQFYVQVYKIDTIKNLLLDKIINEAFSDAKMSLGSDYLDYDNDNEFRISSALVGVVTNKPVISN